jgi:site-specific recombinase XerC
VSQLGNGYALKPARAQLGSIRVREITRSDVEKLIRSTRERGLSQRSMVVTLNPIRQVLAYAITEGLTPINVATSVKVPRKQHSDARPVAVWEPAELVRFGEVPTPTSGPRAGGSRRADCAGPRSWA